MEMRLVGHSNWIPDTRHEPVAKSSKTLDKIERKKCSIQKQSKHSKNVFIDSSAHEHSCKNTNGYEECMKQLTVDCSLTTVMHVFRGEKKFECRECGKQFLHYSHLKTHKHIHMSGMIFKCDVCEKSFPDTDMLETHRIIHQKRHKCQECGREFFLRYELSDHIRSHKRAVKFSCKVCGKLYKRIGSLNNHMQVHSIKNNHRCEDGSKHIHEKFSSLLEPITEKQFECQECGKQFHRKKNLLQHLIIHRERKYRCQECGRKFRKEITVRLHKALHNEEKKYECTVCRKKFHKENHLNAHMMSHTGKKYRCQACGKYFLYEINLEKHRKKEYRCQENSKCTGLNDCEDEKKDAQFSNIVRSSFNNNCENKYESKMSKESFSDNHFQRQRSTLDSAESQSGTRVNSCALPVDCGDGIEKHEVACQTSEKCSSNHKDNQSKESEIIKTDDPIFIKQEVVDDEFLKKKYVVEYYHFSKAQRNMKTEFGNTDFVKEEIMNWELTVKDEDLGENVC